MQEGKRRGREKNKRLLIIRIVIPLNGEKITINIGGKLESDPEMEMAKTDTKGRESSLLVIKYDQRVEFFSRIYQKTNKKKE